MFRYLAALIACVLASDPALATAGRGWLPHDAMVAAPSPALTLLAWLVFVAVVFALIAVSRRVTRVF